MKYQHRFISPARNVVGYLGRPALVFTALACASQICSAQTAPPANYDPAFVQQMLKRLDAQETEIKKLKSDLSHQLGDAGGAAEAAKAETFPKVSFHGFGDASYKFVNGVEEAGHVNKNAFAIGQLDFFVTSRLTENISILGEVVMEANEQSNEMGIDLERLLFQWKPSDYLNVDIGRFHSSVGYYNTSYHHGTWFQTATGRPGFLDFEDGGGVIPAHNVGIHLSGEIPSGSLGLGYIFEVGNGRPYDQNNPGKVPNVADDNDNKSFNVAFVARPEALPGLQLGAGVYHDTLTPKVTTLATVNRTEEFMFHSHVVYKQGPWEYLSEGYLIRHRTVGDKTHLTPAGFGQLAYKVNAFTPFARFSYINALASDQVWPVIGVNGLRYGPGGGLRWDFSTLAALKLQYDYLYTSTSTVNGLAGVVSQGFQGWTSTVTAQVAFTF